MKVFIDPRCKINYASYYIYGLWKLLGKQNIKFSSARFIDLEFDNNLYNKGFAFIVEGANAKMQKRVFIDFGDPDSVSDLLYDWCDTYAKINVTAEDLKLRSKIVAIGPSFGINILGFWNLKLLSKLLFVNNRPKMLYYLKDSLYMYWRRKRFDAYLGSQSKSDYIFSISTLWYDEKSYNTTNKFRGDFLEICDKYYKIIEGGFFYLSNQSTIIEFPKYKEYLKKYSKYLITKRIKPGEYISKTKQSHIVFNTPSVHGCHGWKLGEFLAMGKAIISTELHNELPASLTDVVCFVSGKLELESTVKKIIESPQLKSSLEKKASEYFSVHLHPAKVVNKIIYFESSTSY